MTLCLIVSAYCGSHSKTLVSQVFKSANRLITRCGKVGNGDILLLFQDVTGAWCKYEWVNYLNSNDRKLIQGYISKHHDLCMQQLSSAQPEKATKPEIDRDDTGTSSNNNNDITLFEQLKHCILDCKNHSIKLHSASFIYNIVVIGHEQCLSFNPETLDEEHAYEYGNDTYLDAHKSNARLRQILCLARTIPCSINMMCVCPPLQHASNATYIDFELHRNCCSVCTQQFFRSKPNKQKHFGKACHQIALKQIEIQSWHGQHPPPSRRRQFVPHSPSQQLLRSPSLLKTPLAKKRKLNTSATTTPASVHSAVSATSLTQSVVPIADADTQVLISHSVLFWQQLIDSTHGIFRWMLTDFNQANVDTVLQAVTSKIDSHLKLRHLALGCLLGQCLLFPGPNNTYFAPPQNGHGKCAMFASLNEQQLKSEIEHHMATQLRQQQPCNSVIQCVHANLQRSAHKVCPLNILQENQLNVAIGGDILSIVGFLDRDTEFMCIPVLSRHFVVPFSLNATTANTSSGAAANDEIASSANNSERDSSSNSGANNADITMFVKDLLAKYNKICVVALNAIHKPHWFGFMYLDKQSNGKYLLLDILSPHINVAQLLRNANTEQSSASRDDAAKSPLEYHDRCCSLFPNHTNIGKDFDKLIRSLRQKKIAECFTVAEVIRKRAHSFHIPELITQLCGVIKTECAALKLDSTSAKEKELKYALDVLLKELIKSQTDHKVVLCMPPPRPVGSGKHRHK